MHRLTWYRERFPEQPPLPVAERAGDEILSLPLSPAHSDDDIRDVIEALRPRMQAHLRRMRAAPVRVAATLVFTGLAVAYLRLEDRPRPDDRRALRRRLWWLLLAVAIMNADGDPDGRALAVAAAPRRGCANTCRG